MKHFIKKYPFLLTETLLTLLRISVAFIFLSHSNVRITNSTVGQFGEFMEIKGFPNGVVWVWGITFYEIVGGILLAFGYFAKWLSAGFILILIVGIILIHASFGWFVGEHGTGGSEYSFILIVALFVIAAVDRDKKLL